MDRDKFMELVYETFFDEPDNLLANSIIEAADAYVEYEKAQFLQEDKWCTDCKEYDTEKHCCPRFNKVIRQALVETQPKLTDEQVIDYCTKKGYVILKKEPIFQAGYQNKEIRFYIGGRLFAIRELAQ